MASRLVSWLCAAGLLLAGGCSAPVAEQPDGEEIADVVEAGDLEPADVEEEQVDLGEFDLFSDKVILAYDLEIPVPPEFASWQDLLMSHVQCPVHCSGPKREYEPATLTFHNPWTGQDEVVEQVGVRFRGNSSACGPENARVGFKLSFNEFVKGQEFHGVKKLNFMGTEGDESLMREYSAFRMLRAFGVPASREGFATISVNGEEPRLYPVGEVCDVKPFLENAFPGEEVGHLYKVDGYCGAGTFEYVSDNPDDYQPTYAPEAGAKGEDMTEDLIPLIKCFTYEDDAEFKTCFEEHVELEAVLRAFAVDLSLPDYDGISNAGQNFSIYFRKGSPKAMLILWDKDAAFRQAYCDQTLVLDCSPPWSGRSPNVARVLKLYDQEIRDRIGELLLGPYSIEELDDNIAALEKRLAPYADKDPDMVSHVKQWDWTFGVLDLKYDVENRRVKLQEYLDGRQ